MACCFAQLQPDVQQGKDCESLVTVCKQCAKCGLLVMVRICMQLLRCICTFDPVPV